MNKKVLVLLLLLLNFLIVSAISILPKYASLTAKGTSIKIKTEESVLSVKLKVSNQLKLFNDGVVSCLEDFDPKNCNAWVVALDTITGATDTCKISIVPWTANVSTLNINKVLNGGYRIFGKIGDTLIVNYKNILYKTGGDLTKLIPLSPFQLLSTDYYWAFLKTPAGYFIRNEENIYFSKDERNWELDYTTKGRGIRNSFAYKYDSISQTTRIFAHDYSVTGKDTFPHSVYRKTISPLNQNSQWEKVFTLFSKDQWAKDKSLFPACRHIHTLNIDPYTGQIWIGTGDSNQHNHIFYSDDNGNTWNHVGMGSQEWRVLSIWFTSKYIYWCMDSSETQKIYRISRDVYNAKGLWPDMSKKLTSGYPQNSIYYLIASIKDTKYYEYSGGAERFVGDIVSGNPSFRITDNNSLISLNDPELDYRELVATLPNSALWCNATLVDNKGDNIVVISSNNEGHKIDYRPRVFGIKERIDGTVDVQELLSTNQGNKIYSQFYPYEQDALGNMYFQTQEMNSSIYKWNDIIQTTLDWHDASMLKGGEVIDLKEFQDSVQFKVKLVNFDGDIIEWQEADKTFKWKKLIVPTNDIIFVNRDQSKIKYIRAIVQKDNNSPISSNFLKLDSVTENKTNITTNLNNNNQHFTCYPIPASDRLIIHLNVDSSAVYNIQLTTLISQKKIYNDYHELSSKFDFQLPLFNLSSGIYILTILGNKVKENFKVIIK